MDMLLEIVSAVGVRPDKAVLGAVFFLGMLFVGGMFGYCLSFSSGRVYVSRGRMAVNVVLFVLLFAGFALWMLADAGHVRG